MIYFSFSCCFELYGGRRPRHAQVLKLNVLHKFPMSLSGISMSMIQLNNITSWLLTKTTVFFSSVILRRIMFFHDTGFPYYTGSCTFWVDPTPKARGNSLGWLWKLAPSSSSHHHTGPDWKLPSVPYTLSCLSLPRPYISLTSARFMPEHPKVSRWPGWLRSREMEQTGLEFILHIVGRSEFAGVL